MNKEKQKIIADRIKKRREQFHYTQEQFAELVDITHSSYVKIENAFQRPSIDTLIRIAEKLNLSLDYILLGKSEIEPPTNAELLSIILEIADPEKLVHTRDLLDKIIKIKDAQSHENVL